MDEIVSLENVSVHFNSIPVLEDITLSIMQNDFLAIIGPNGGGKTTLLKVILGLVKPSKGKVKVFGGSPEKGRKFIGYLPQYAFLNQNFPISVFEVVLMGRYRGVFQGFSDEDKTAVINALKIVGMLKFKDRRINELSGGQLQRVFIARAVVKEPKLLLLDEPTASIDPEMQKTFYELLQEIKKKMAVVLVSHDVGAVSVHADKVACLNRKLFYHGKKEGLKMFKEIYGSHVELIFHEHLKDF
ncbi:MAG: ABC transporter ATP-binding protein [Candidatus Bathyarchaeota archaeon]|nr:ABC transporter ATP-binding protein [Candidatus Bathyarchaeota archaeon]